MLTLPSYEIIISVFPEFLTLIMSWIYIIQFIIITLGILIITIYLPRKAESLAFLHRLGFGYVLFNLWMLTLDRQIIPSENFFTFLDSNSPLESFSAWQEDPFFSHFFFIFATGIVLIFFYGLLDRYFIKNGDETEFALLVCFLALSTLCLFHVHNLIEFLLAIETVTLASYVFAGYERQNAQSTFASVQYFILGSIPSGMLILGLSLIYGYSGVLTFEDLDLMLYENDLRKTETPFLINEWLDSYSVTFSDLNNITLLTTIDNWGTATVSFKDQIANIEDFISPRTSILIASLLFILFNLLFKLTAAPFHFWAPSVYKYAPIASVTYLSIFSKAMVIFLLVKITLVIFYSYTLLLTPILMVCAVITVLIGLTGAFTELFIKAFYVYSSMGHVGFMLVGLGLFTLTGLNATFHYLAIYIISSFIMWFILLHLGQNSVLLMSLNELKKTDSFLALIFAFLIFSMSGIPPLGGFFIKLDILSALLETSRFGINIVLFLFTVASFFYYLRITKIIFFDDNGNYVKRKWISAERMQIITICFFILLFYIIIIQSPLLIAQGEALSVLL